jgi:pimeloyl-ACP methyl ester carboxylesterase
MLPGLAPHFTTHALDLPGFGGSDRPRAYGYTVDAFAHTVAGLMDRIGISRACMIGHSLGGAVALNTAACFPERVRRVVVVDPTMYPFRLPAEARLVLAPLLGQRLFKALWRRRELARFLRRYTYGVKNLLSDEALEAYWESLDRPGGREAAYQTLVTLASLEALENIPRRVRCPVLVVWGTDDRLVPPTHGQRLADTLWDGQLELLHGVGHTPIEQAPRRVLELAVPFLGG